MEVDPQLGRHGEGNTHPGPIHHIRTPSYSAILLLALGADRGNPCIGFRVEGGAGAGNEVPVVDIGCGRLAAHNDRIIGVVLATVDFGADGGGIGGVLLGTYGCKAIGADFEIGAVLLVGGRLVADCTDGTYDVGAGFMGAIALGFHGTARGGEDFGIEIFPDAFLDGRVIDQVETLYSAFKGGGVGSTIGGKGVHFCSGTFFAKELNEVVQGVGWRGFLRFRSSGFFLFLRGGFLGFHYRG